MGICWVESCMGDAFQRCSGCKTATYCDNSCQKDHWPIHKKECKKHRILYDLNEKITEEEKTHPLSKPRKTHCTGCNEKFKKGWVEVDQECPNCGYITCESCSCHGSRGSCHCSDSNFGRYNYCESEPRQYHFGRRGMYSGDYHPSKEDGNELNQEDFPEAFEDKKRPCNRCGKVVYILEKEYRRETWY